MNSFDVLVIILSIAFFIFLVVSIVLVVSVIRLVKKVREITDTATEIVHDVEAVSGIFKKTAGPVALTGLISNIVSKVTEYKGKRDK